MNPPSRSTAFNLRRLPYELPRQVRAEGTHGASCAAVRKKCQRSEIFAAWAELIVVAAVQRNDYNVADLQRVKLAAVQRGTGTRKAFDNPRGAVYGEGLVPLDSEP